jgi:hypothetical protein
VVTPDELAQAVAKREVDASRPLKPYDPCGSQEKSAASTFVSGFIGENATVWAHVLAFALGFFIGTLFYVVALATIEGSAGVLPAPFVTRYVVDIMPPALAACVLASSAFFIGLCVFPLKCPSLFSLKLGFWYSLFGLPMAGLLAMAGLFITKAVSGLWFGAALLLLACGLAPKFANPTRANYSLKRTAEGRLR